MGHRTFPRRWAAPLAVALAPALVLGACGDDDDGDAATFCDRLVDLTENDPFASLGDAATASQMEAAMTALRARAEELVDVAPEVARGATTDYRDAVVAVDDLLAEAGYSPARLDVGRYQAASKDYAAAAVRLERHLTAEC